MVAQGHRAGPWFREEFRVDVVGRAVGVEIRAGKSRGDEHRAGGRDSAEKLVDVRVPGRRDLLPRSGRGEIRRVIDPAVRRIEDERRGRVRGAVDEQRGGGHRRAGA